MSASPEASDGGALPVREILPGVFVAPQLTPQAMAAAARAGFRAVVNNRPDHEHGPDQPTHAQIAQAAQAAGLAYHFLPVAPNHHTPQEVAAFADLLHTLPRPLLVFCRSGARSTRLIMAAQAD